MVDPPTRLWYKMEVLATGEEWKGQLWDRISYLYEILCPLEHLMVFPLSSRSPRPSLIFECIWVLDIMPYPGRLYSNQREGGKGRRTQFLPFIRNLLEIACTPSGYSLLTRILSHGHTKLQRLARTSVQCRKGVVRGDILALIWSSGKALSSSSLSIMLGVSIL